MVINYNNNALKCVLNTFFYIVSIVLNSYIVLL